MKTLMLEALRKGTSVANPTPFKWVGLVVAVALVALKGAQAMGYLQEVSDEAVIEIVMALVIVYSQVATTDKIGLLPSHSAKPGSSQDNE